MDRIDIWEVLTGDIRNLEIITRYQTIPVLHKESVAAHVAMTGWISYFIAKEVRNRGAKVNMEKVLEKSLFHDIGEATTGDVVRSVKHSNKNLLALLDSAEEQSVMNSEKNIGIPGLTAVWKHAKDKSIEGQIVRLADFLSVVSYCQQELELGNKKIMEVIGEVAKYLVEIADGRGKIENSILKSIALEISGYLEVIQRKLNPLTLSLN